MSDRQKRFQDGDAKGLAYLLTKTGPYKEGWSYIERHKEDLTKAIGPLQTHTIDDVWLGVINGLYQMWVRPDSVVITELVAYPRCKSLRIFLAAGKLDEILDIEKDLCEYARAQGCRFIEHGGGRKGWQRIAERLDYHVACPLLVKRVNDG